MPNIVGRARNDEHTCFYYYDDRKENIKQLCETHGLKILGTMPYQIADSCYSYNASGATFQKIINEDVLKDEYTGVYYVLKDASVERVVGRLRTPPVPDQKMTTFLNTYNEENMNYLQFETHESFFNHQDCRDG